MQLEVTVKGRFSVLQKLGADITASVVSEHLEKYNDTQGQVFNLRLN